MTKPFTNVRTNQTAPDVRDLDPRELWERRGDVAIIDVRRPDEFSGELGHVPGARLITLDVLPQRATELVTDRPVVFVCRSGQRSARAVQFAQQQGLRDVFNLEGGMLKWNELALPTEAG